jgi:hypothetical protein
MELKPQLLDFTYNKTWSVVQQAPKSDREWPMEIMAVFWKIMNR